MTRNGKETVATQVKLISKTHVKKFALSMGETRAWKFTRISDEFYVACEAAMKNFIRGRVDNHPSKGVTLT